MAKSLSGVEERSGEAVVIGDNRYGLREEYDPAEKERTYDYYRRGDQLTVREVKNPNSQTVKTVKAK
jgi:hypothetical protein